MSISTVSTYAMFQSTLNDVSSVESNLQKEQMQLSSGNANQSYAQMGTQTQQYLSLTDAMAQTTQYLNSHQVVEANVNTTSQTLGQVITTATSLQSLISQRLSGTADTSAFGTQLSGLWQTITGQLNTQLNGQYLFSGSKTDTAPVDSANFPTLVKPGVPDTGYYKGSDQDLTARIDSETVVTYNIRANSPAFQQIYAGIAMAQTGDQANDTAMLQKAETMIQQGLQGVTALQAHVGATASQLATSDTALQSTNLYWKGLQESIGNTDIVSVSTQVAVNQGILQAAFQAFSKINSLNLSDYLR